MRILVTGGAGYIGSHCSVLLLQAGYEVVIVDNLINSHENVIDRIEKIAGHKPIFEKGDVRDKDFLVKVLESHKCDAVIHFAGLKAVGESQIKPEIYYDNNVAGSLQLLQAMKETGAEKMIFSSTATVYGEPKYLPYDENHPLAPENVYGETKLIVENMLRDFQKAYPRLSFCVLRYFNPVGAHESGLIGEDPKGIPNNLMPIIAQVASGQREKLMIWGNDYDTKDGTGVRDYIHVIDLAQGHINALKLLEKPGLEIINLGSGHGYSVMEVLKTFEHVSNKKINYEVTSRRLGDIASYFADTKTAKTKLNWQANKDLYTMCADMWNYQVKNPN